MNPKSKPTIEIPPVDDEIVDLDKGEEERVRALYEKPPHTDSEQSSAGDGRET